MNKYGNSNHAPVRAVSEHGRWDHGLMERYRSFEYLESRRMPHRRELFRTARLNAVGWAAVAGLCAIGAGIGLLLARISGAATWIAMPFGAAAALGSLGAADRRKWAAMSTSYSWTDDLSATQEIADLLTRAGVAVSVEVDDFGQPMLQYLNRDRRHVHRVFRSAALPSPPKD